MKSAIQSFLILTSLLLICAIAIWVILRNSGYSEPGRPQHQHAFFKDSPRDIVAYHPNNGAGAMAELDSIASTSKDVVLWVDVRPRFDSSMARTLVAVGRDEKTDGAPRLKDVLARYPQHRMILNFRINHEGMVEAVVKELNEASAFSRVLIQSPEEGFLKGVRELQPLGLFGSSLPALTRFVMLSTVGLESLAPLKGDVLVVEIRARERLGSRLNDAMIREARRRGMRVYAGPAADSSETLQLWNRGIDGVITDTPEELLRVRSSP